MSVKAAVILILILAGAAGAMELGIGPMLGTPLGLSAKLWTRTGLAFDLGLGYAWWNDSCYQAHTDILFHSRHLTGDPGRDGALGLYVGLGGQMRLATRTAQTTTYAGLRMPLGMEYIFPNNFISLYAEAVPIFNLGTTDQYFSGEGAAGFRVYWRVGSTLQ